MPDPALVDPHHRKPANAARAEVVHLLRPMAAILCAVVMVVCVLGLVSSPGTAALRTVVVLVVASIAQCVLVFGTFRSRRTGPMASVHQSVERRAGQVGIDQRQQ